MKAPIAQTAAEAAFASGLFFSSLGARNQKCINKNSDFGCLQIYSHPESVSKGGVIYRDVPRLQGTKAVIIGRHTWFKLKH
jgi:hypothetical protein